LTQLKALPASNAVATADRHLGGQAVRIKTKNPKFILGFLMFKISAILII